MQRRQYRPAEDCHYKPGRSEFGIIAKPVERNSVDGGEHERHAARHGNETVHSPNVLEEYHAECKYGCGYGQNLEQLAGVEILEQECAYKPAHAEEPHGNHVVELRFHFGLLFGHAHFHEYPCAILDDERPAHDLRTDVEELRYHAFAVARQREDALHGGDEIDFMRLVAILGHLGKTHDEEHGKNDEAYDKVWRDECGEVGIAYGDVFGFAQCFPCGSVHRVQLVLYEVHCHIHAEQ